MRELLSVSRETEARLHRFADHLKRWTRAKNLVGPETLTSLWTRHIADSAQVLAAVPDSRRWVDLGSGAGFPGLIVAILIADMPGASVHLVESNGRKCAFLRAAARDCGAPAHIHNDRIEKFVENWRAPVDVVTARALAPLGKLVEMAAPLIKSGALAVFHKGQDVERELTEASTCWTLDYELVPSQTQGGSALVIIRDCERKSA
ncbi:MAG: 16S rRNA (guanine(527)-N(7))-methyltransferase RsmG [Planctomycetes bacterium]|nr:16S rRNA (guanine(527)-N(7))-methyltransferase RsmG [Planctomycetota bacterium]